MASFQFLGKAVLKALKWKPRTRSSEETDTLSVPQGETDVTTGSEVTEGSPLEVTTSMEETVAAAPPSNECETGNENPKDAEASETTTLVEEASRPGESTETPEKKSSSFRRRKFGAFMRPISAKSFATDVENAKRGSKKGKKKFFGHVRALSMGHYHSIQKQQPLEGTKSVPHLTRPSSADLMESDLAAFGASVTESNVSVTEINVVDVDGNQEVFVDEVGICGGSRINGGGEGRKCLWTSDFRPKIS